MTSFKLHCTAEVADKLLVLEENKRKCVFVNPRGNLLTKVIVDGCQITEGVRCDYLVLDASQNEYFVELKGKDIPHAIEQLESTIRQLSIRKEVLKTAVIVASRHPSNDTSLQRAKAYFKRKYGVELISKNTRIDIKV